MTDIRGFRLPALSNKSIEVRPGHDEVVEHVNVHQGQ